MEQLTAYMACAVGACLVVLTIALVRIAWRTCVYTSGIKQWLYARKRKAHYKKSLLRIELLEAA